MKRSPIPTGPDTVAEPRGSGSDPRATAAREFAAALRHMPSGDLVGLDPYDLWDFLIPLCSASPEASNFCERLRWELHRRRASGFFGPHLARP